MRNPIGIRRIKYRGEAMDMDIAKIMQMMSNNGNNKDMSMLMQLLPSLMNNNRNASKPETLKLNEDEINKTLSGLYDSDE